MMDGKKLAMAAHLPTAAVTATDDAAYAGPSSNNPSTAMYRQIVEASATGILVLDLDGRVRYANAALAALTGLSPAALHGQAFGALLLATDVTDLLHLPTSGKHERDVKFRRADGSAIWTLCTVSALATGPGACLLVAVTDISARKRTEDALRASEHRLRALVDNEPECVKLMDADGRLLHINQAGLDMIGADKPEEVLGKSVYGLIAPKDRDGYRNLHVSVTHGGTGCAQFEIATLKGARRWLETTVVPFPGENGDTLILGITRDISERRQAEAALRNSEELLRLVLQTLPLGVWVFDAQQRVLMDNAAGKTLLADAAGADGEAQQACQRAVAAALTTGAAVHHDIVEYDAPAGRRTILHSAVPIRDGAGQIRGAIAVKQDVSEYRRAQERIHFLASYDPLTGLANRRLFTERLQTALGEGTNASGAVLLLDLDRFKTVNESLGHAAGDELLRAMAHCLTQYLRADATLAYLSGDEFGLLFPGLTDLEEIEALAEALLGAIAEPVRIGAREFFISSSMGIALYPRDGAEPNEILRHADVALYRAKADGRNTYRLYAQNGNKATLDRLDLERELRRAIEREAFVLHYQPQLDIASNRVVGAEALVRWNHDSHGVVSPAQFIPLAEETGLIVPLSEWILAEACRQGSAWRAAGLGRLRIAVNMSGFSFKSGGPKQRNIAHTIEGILARTGHAADDLEIELTESMLMHDVTETLQLLADVSALGVHLAIDDFGIGYSSLNYLKRFPIDVLKIDQSFVGDLAHDPNDAAIVSAIIGLAHTLDLCVVAEGVETATQLQFLRDRRCDLYQGYLAARPLAADVFAAHLREHKPAQ